MAFKMKGFPMQSTKSALKQASPLKDWQSDDPTHNNNYNWHDTMTGAPTPLHPGFVSDTPIGGPILCPRNAASGGTIANPTGGAPPAGECGFYIESTGNQAADDATIVAHEQSAHQAPVISNQAIEELTVADPIVTTTTTSNKNKNKSNKSKKSKSKKR